MLSSAVAASAVGCLSGILSEPVYRVFCKTQKNQIQSCQSKRLASGSSAGHKDAMVRSQMKCLVFEDSKNRLSACALHKQLPKASHQEVLRMKQLQAEESLHVAVSNLQIKQAEFRQEREELLRMRQELQLEESLQNAKVKFQMQQDACNQRREELLMIRKELQFEESLHTAISDLQMRQDKFERERDELLMMKQELQVEDSLHTAVLSLQIKQDESLRQLHSLKGNLKPVDGRQRLEGEGDSPQIALHAGGIRPHEVESIAITDCNAVQRFAGCFNAQAPAASNEKPFFTKLPPQADLVSENGATSAPILEEESTEANDSDSPDTASHTSDIAPCEVQPMHRMRWNAEHFNSVEQIGNTPPCFSSPSKSSGKPPDPIEADESDSPKTISFNLGDTTPSETESINGRYSSRNILHIMGDIIQCPTHEEESICSQDSPDIVACSPSDTATHEVLAESIDGIEWNAARLASLVETRSMAEESSERSMAEEFQESSEENDSDSPESASRMCDSTEIAYHTHDIAPPELESICCIEWNAARLISSKLSGIAEETVEAKHSDFSGIVSHMDDALHCVSPKEKSSVMPDEFKDSPKCDSPSGITLHHIGDESLCSSDSPRIPSNNIDDATPREVESIYGMDWNAASFNSKLSGYPESPTQTVREDISCNEDDASLNISLCMALPKTNVNPVDCTETCEIMKSLQKMVIMKSLQKICEVTGLPHFLFCEEARVRNKARSQFLGSLERGSLAAAFHEQVSGASSKACRNVHQKVQADLLQALNNSSLGLTLRSTKEDAKPQEPQESKVLSGALASSGVRCDAMASSCREVAQSDAQPNEAATPPEEATVRAKLRFFECKVQQHSKRLNLHSTSLGQSPNSKVTFQSGCSVVKDLAAVRVQKWTPDKTPPRPDHKSGMKSQIPLAAPNFSKFEVMDEWEIPVWESDSESESEAMDESQSSSTATLSQQIVSSALRQIFLEDSKKLNGLLDLEEINL